MKNIKKTLAGIIAVTTVITSAVSCRKNVTGNLSVEPNTDIPIAMKPEEATAPDENSISDEMEIVWLADYDLNPPENENRSIAVALFEDVFGGKIKFVHTSAEEKFDNLASMILSGDEVDMFEYEPNALPDGVKKKQYDPLDPYFSSLEIESSIWDDMRDVIERFEYEGGHYVIPYSVSNPVVLTYSRKMIEENNLDDPYELYQKGEWDWDIFMEMMKKFQSNTGGNYGINGFVGKSLLHSSGNNIVNYKNGKLVNNVNCAEIKEAQLFMQEIANNGLYSPYRNESFPSGKSTLFFAAPDWTIGYSNVNCPDMDFMAVPFPKAPESDTNYIACDFNAKMLVKNSQKGDAVATYIKCERFAETQEDYKEPAKEFALMPQKNTMGTTVSYITEEQYDVLQEYTDLSKVTPIVDFAYGMGNNMYTLAGSDGIIDRLEKNMLLSGGNYETWKPFRNECSAAIKEEIERLK